MNLLDGILEFFFPRRCAFCHRLTQNDAGICPRCRATLPFTETAAKQELPPLSACYSPLYYVDPVRKSLLRFKFGGLSMYAEVYGEFLVKCIDENRISCDSISWVPLSRRRLRRRGYDQARLLAEAVAKRSGIPCVPSLRKLRHTRAQSATGGAEKRRKNVRNAYAAIHTEEIKGSTVLLIDDIVTTGATLCECAGVLKKAGVKEIIGLTLARRKD